MKLISKLLLCFTFFTLFTQLGYSQTKSVGVNIALLSAGILNTELSVGVKSRISIHMPLTWSGFVVSNEFSLKNYSVSPGVRFWSWHIYSGFFAGTNLGFANYNAVINKRRYCGNTFFTSLSAGYSKMVSQKLNIEGEFGLGAFGVWQDVFESGKCGEFLRYSEKIAILPSKISISLIYIL